MNEYEYSFLEDVKTRKSIAASAKKKKNGSKSRVVSFPSDQMTKKQWESKNGEVVTVQMNQPMTYQEFKSIPKDLQESYLACLMDGYGASVRKIAQMMGVNYNTLSSLIRRSGFTKVKPTLGGKMSAEQMQDWNNFLNQGQQEAKSPEEPAERQAAVGFTGKWTEFISGTVSEQREILKQLRSKFGVGTTLIAQMMGVDRETFYKHCLSHGLDYILRGKTNPTEEQLARFKHYCESMAPAEEPERESSTAAEEPERKLVAPAVAVPTSFSLQFIGKLTVGELAAAISRICCGTELNGIVRITFEGE